MSSKSGRESENITAPKPPHKKKEEVTEEQQRPEATDETKPPETVQMAASAKFDEQKKTSDDDTVKTKNIENDQKADEPPESIESTASSEKKTTESVVSAVAKIEEHIDEVEVKTKNIESDDPKADVEDGECVSDSPSQQAQSNEGVKVSGKIGILIEKLPVAEASDDGNKSDPEDGECFPENDLPPKLRSVVVEKRVDVAEKKHNKSTAAKDSERDSYSARGRKQDTRRREEDRRRRDRSRSYSRSRSRDRRRRNDEPSSRDQRPTDSPAAEKPDPSVITRRQQRTVDLLTSKTGGAYIPPAKLRLLQAEITDKSSAAYQRIAWEALKKSIHGYINKVNVDNIGIITRELLKENIVRGRGLICRSIIQAQAASPTFTHVYAALVSVINSKFPNIGELLLKRLVIQFKRGFRRNDKMVCLSASRFIAHLVNQRVAHEILALEILTLLVETPTDDSVEVAIAFLKESGMKLQEVSSKGVNAIFEMLKNILHEGRLDKRVQYMIEVVFQVRKDGFKDHVAVQEALELVEEDDQFTHLIMLEEATEAQDVLSKYSFFT